MKNRFITQRVFFFGMVAILLIIALILVWQFIKAILLAVAVVIILKPLYIWLLNRKWINGSEKRATVVTLLIFILLIAIPTTIIIAGAITQAADLFSGLDLGDLDFSLQEINSWFEGVIQKIIAGSFQLDEFRFSDSIAQAIAVISGWLKGFVISLGRSLPRLFTNAIVILVILFVLLPRYKSPGRQDILDIVPFPPQITQLFLDKIDLMIKAMFKGTFVIAIAQGLAMGLVFWIAGVPFVMLFTILSILLSFVPLIGISLLAWPIGIVLILYGNIWQGVFIIVTFVLLIANIDTVLRPKLIPKGAQLNPALIILSVFGGLGVMGIVGALYGPVVMILLVTSIEVYTKYLLRSDLETLEKQGRVDLEELGLVAQEEEGAQNIGEMFFTALKNVSARFRKEPSNNDGYNQAAEELGNSP